MRLSRRIFELKSSASALLELVREKLHEFSTSDAAAVLRHVASAPDASRVRFAEPLSRLLSFMRQHGQEFQPQQLADIAWACAKLGNPDPTLVAKIGQ